MARFTARRWVAISLLAIALSACSSTSKHDATTSGASGFPVRVAATGGTVTIPSRPRRIVSLSPTGTEDLYALGAGGQVIAVDSYSIYPPQAPRTNLSGYTPDVEAIAKYQPDLVVLSEDNDHVIAQLQKLSIPVLFVPPASSLAAAYQEIDQLGRATGHSRAAGPLVEKIERELAAIARSVPRPRPPLRVYHELEPTFYSATSQSFIGQIYTMLGITNIADEAHGAGPYPQLSAEYIIASDPSLIVLADTVCCKQSAATVAARPGWSHIEAVETGAIVPVEDAIASEWGPRIVDFARDVADAVKRLEARPR